MWFPLADRLAMDDMPLPEKTSDPKAFAAYVAAITAELSRLARDNGLTTLAYILEMARLEARSSAVPESDPVHREDAKT